MFCYIALFVMALKAIMWQFCCLWRTSIRSMNWLNAVNSFCWVKIRHFVVSSWPMTSHYQLSRKSVSTTTSAGYDCCQHSALGTVENHGQNC